MKRILIATAVVSAAGAAATTIAAVLAMLIAQVMQYGIRSVWDVWTLSALLGLAELAAIIGAVAVPIVGWVFLRRVPIWLGAVATSVGAIVGGMLGERWHPYMGDSDGFPGATVGMLSGFLLTAIALSVWFRNRERRVAEAER